MKHELSSLEDQYPDLLLRQKRRIERRKNTYDENLTIDDQQSKTITIE